jgi:hypothetical protein
MGNGLTKRSLDVIPALEDQLSFFSEKGYAELISLTRFRLVNKYLIAINEFGVKKYQKILKKLLLKTPLSMPDYTVYQLIMPIKAPFVYPYLRIKDVLERRGLLGSIKQYLNHFKRFN